MPPGIDAADDLHFEAFAVVADHFFHHLFDFLVGNAEFFERIAAEGDCRMQHLTHLIIDAGAHQLDGVFAIEGAHQHFHQRKLVLHQFDDLVRGRRIVDADQDRLRPARACRMQSMKLRAVAVIDLEAEVAGVLLMIWGRGRR